MRSAFVTTLYNILQAADIKWCQCYQLSTHEQVLAE